MTTIDIFFTIPSLFVTPQNKVKATFSDIFIPVRYFDIRMEWVLYNLPAEDTEHEVQHEEGPDDD